MSGQRLSRFYLTKRTSLLILFSFFNSCLLILRINYSKSNFYFFLTWNLFLAWIPYIISKLIYIRVKLAKDYSSVLFYLFLGLWLLFFPNAPYIITDFFHLKHYEPVPLWFDLILITSYAINGLFLGLYSLYTLQVILIRKHKIISWIFVFGSLFLSSFGIYLGRYLRWNSWDIVSNPQFLFKDIFRMLSTPQDHRGLYGMTFLFFILFCFIYLIIHPYQSDEE